MFDYCFATLKIVVILTSLTPPVEPQCPDLTLVSREFLQVHGCDGEPCDIYALYAGQDTIFLLADLDYRNSLAASSIVVQQLTHWLQYHNGMMKNTDCESKATLIFQAYTAQALYLAHYGVDWNPPKYEDLIKDCNGMQPLPTETDGGVGL